PGDGREARPDQPRLLAVLEVVLDALREADPREAIGLPRGELPVPRRHELEGSPLLLVAVELAERLAEALESRDVLVGLVLGVQAAVDDLRNGIGGVCRGGERACDSIDVDGHGSRY